MTATFDIGAETVRFELIPDRSAVLVEARSNVGPIAFGTTAVRGYIETAMNGTVVGADSASAAHVTFDLKSLKSGNALYDAELLRRVDARGYPVTSVELRDVVRIGDSDRFRVTGDLTFHGITRSMSGTVAVSLGADGTLAIVGEHVFDIRDFELSAPAILMLRIYPDVRVQLQLEARHSLEVTG